MSIKIGGRSGNKVLQTHKELSIESSYFLQQSRWKLKNVRKRLFGMSEL